MGLGVAQDEAQLRPRTPFSRPRTLKNESQKIRKKHDEGTKMGPENCLKSGLKTDPNIISLSFGSPGLSGVGARPCQAKMQAKS